MSAFDPKRTFSEVTAMTGAGAIYYSYGVELTGWIETAGLLVLLVAAITDYRALNISASAAKQAATQTDIFLILAQMNRF